MTSIEKGISNSERDNRTNLIIQDKNECRFSCPPISPIGRIKQPLYLFF